MVVLQSLQLYLATSDVTKDNIFFIPCKKLWKYPLRRYDLFDRNIQRRSLSSVNASFLQKLTADWEFIAWLSHEVKFWLNNASQSCNLLSELPHVID